MSPVGHHTHLALTDAVRDEKVTNVDMLRSLPTRSLPVRLKKHGALVVLEQNVVLDMVTLSFHKVTGPANCWHEIVRSNDLALS